MDDTEIQATEVTELPTLAITPGISLAELHGTAEAFYNDFDPEAHDEADMVAAHSWASQLSSTAKVLKGLSGAVFVKWLEHRGGTHPVLVAKSKTPKGQPREQKLDEQGNPIEKFWPAEVIFGQTRFMAKHKSEAKPKMTPGKMLEYLFDEAGGDFEIVAACLSSGAFKQGEVRNAFGEEVWDACFERTETTVLEDGTPRKRHLEEVNTFFVADALRRRASMDAQRESELPADG